jgi:hypothetical protein
MPIRPNAPYEDEVLDDGSTIIYEVHDIPRNGSADALLKILALTVTHL